jgi:hypothetical protein
MEITTEEIQYFIHNNEIELKPKQPNMCIPIINRMCKKMKAGIKFSPVKVISEEHLISDGHHRYLASLIVEYPIEIIKTTRTAADAVGDWKSVDFELLEWETEEDIRKFNTIDAEFNNMSIEQIVEILR